jgi:hypothetical protein
MTGAPGAAARLVPTWSTWAEARQVITYRPHLRQTVLTALIVGTILFAINQLDVVLSGGATPSTWVKAAVTYVVPFAVANIGVLVGRRRPGESRATDPPVG